MIASLGKPATAKAFLCVRVCTCVGLGVRDIKEKLSDGEMEGERKRY